MMRRITRAGRLAFGAKVPAFDGEAEGRTRCPLCGTELPDGAQRFCGGDVCLRVYIK